MQNVLAENELSNSHLDYDLYLLDRVLSDMEKELTDYQIPVNVYDWGHNVVNSLIANELEYNTEQEQQTRDEQFTRLNVDQLNCFNTIVTMIENDSQNAHFFVQGPAGTGKTFLYQTLCHHFRARGDIVICVASSEIATLLLPDDQTSHSRFKISLQVTKEIVCNITRGMHLYELLRRIRLIIWDEVSMQHKHCFTSVHRTLTNVMQNDFIFGGILVVLGGDFAQILPVVKRDNREAIVNANIQQSFL